MPKETQPIPVGYDAILNISAELCCSTTVILLGPFVIQAQCCVKETAAVMLQHLPDSRLNMSHFVGSLSGPTCSHFAIRSELCTAPLKIKLQ